MRSLAVRTRRETSAPPHLRCYLGSGQRRCGSFQSGTRLYLQVASFGRVECSHECQIKAAGGDVAVFNPKTQAKTSCRMLVSALPLLYKYCPPEHRHSPVASADKNRTTRLVTLWPHSWLRSSWNHLFSSLVFSGFHASWAERGKVVRRSFATAVLPQHDTAGRKICLARYN